MTPFLSVILSIVFVLTPSAFVIYLLRRKVSGTKLLIALFMTQFLTGPGGPLGLMFNGIPALHFLNCQPKEPDAPAIEIAIFCAGLLAGLTGLVGVAIRRLVGREKKGEPSGQPPSGP